MNVANQVTPVSMVASTLLALTCAAVTLVILYQMTGAHVTWWSVGNLTECLELWWSVTVLQISTGKVSILERRSITTYTVQAGIIAIRLTGRSSIFESNLSAIATLDQKKEAIVERLKWEWMYGPSTVTKQLIVVERCLLLGFDCMDVSQGENSTPVRLRV